jgi:predicted RecA/RadA family phage recombinase
MPRYLGDGRLCTFTAPEGGVEAGGTYLIGSLIVVSTTMMWGGGTFVGAVSGVWGLAKEPAEAWLQGTKVYWSPTPKVWTTVAANANRLGGCAVGSTLAGSPTGLVRLDGTAR